MNICVIQKRSFWLRDSSSENDILKLWVYVVRKCFKDHQDKVCNFRKEQSEAQRDDVTLMLRVCGIPGARPINRLTGHNPTGPFWDSVHSLSAALGGITCSYFWNQCLSSTMHGFSRHHCMLKYKTQASFSQKFRRWYGLLCSLWNQYFDVHADD
jgi:hypothetical protein